MTLCDDMGCYQCVFCHKMVKHACVCSCAQAVDQEIKKNNAFRAAYMASECNPPLLTTIKIVDSTTSIVDSTLAERGSNYGHFEDGAELMQSLKKACRAHPGWAKLKPYQAEAFEMIIHKMCRAINGNPDYVDNVHDIAGYASLYEKILKGEKP